jgi:hypothetical protein
MLRSKEGKVMKRWRKLHNGNFRISLLHRVILEWTDKGEQMNTWLRQDIYTQFFRTVSREEIILDIEAHTLYIYIYI